MYSVSIRNIENSAVPRMNPATFAAVSVCSRKIENGTSGSLTRSSQPTNPRSSAAAATKTPTVSNELQPQFWPCVTPSTARESPPVTRNAPRASKPWPCRSTLSASRTGARTSPRMPTGTLTKKIHSHERRSVRMPPKRTPAAAPKPPTAPHAPSARLRSRPSRNVVTRMDSAAGVIMAAPRPCSARAPISDASLHAKPQSSEPTENTTRPSMKMRRRPRRSAERPPSRRNPPKTSAYALITHWRFSCEKPRSVWIDGRATFTIAMSSTTMNCVAQRSASASHLRLDEASMCQSPFVLSASIDRASLPPERLGQGAAP